MEPPDTERSGIPVSIQASPGSTHVLLDAHDDLITAAETAGPGGCQPRADRLQ